ncbi:glycosyltransferase family 4 protein [Lysinibacillus sphaericus]|uniref:glycosyltransferase family 4 protein n=1 Tax=Lysinibacillus sphaericus TaxID=1421 RepID=UPI003F7A875B
MKRIGLFLHSLPGYGGTFQYNQSVLHSLCSFPKNSFEIVVAYIREEWKPYLVGLEIETVQLPKVHWAQELGSKWKSKSLSYDLWKELTGDIHPIGKLLKEKRCDLWIFPSQDPYTFQLDVPALGTIHDLMHRYESQFPEVSENQEFEYREWLFNNIAKQTRGILVDSEIGKQHVIETYGVNSDNIFVLPYIPPKYIYNYREEKYILPKDLENSLPSKYIFYPAQYWEHKNHARILDAIKLLKEEEIEVNVVFVGTYEGESRTNVYEKLQELIKQYSLQKQIFFLGYVNDESMPILYEKAKGLIMPTFFGPTNIPPLEAFVMECPVAVSNIYGMPNQLKDAALFFDPSSAEEIAGCIKTLWIDDDVCQTLIKKGLERSKKWGPSQFSERLLEVVDKLT